MLLACLLTTSVLTAEPAVQERQAMSLWLEQLTLPTQLGNRRIDTSASCAATACHGGPRPGIANLDVVRGSEYPLWLEHDPHAQSWRTMCSVASVTILERLNVMRDGKVLNQVALENCLACHNTVQKLSSSFQAEGVGCASCHGPSELWRGDHYRIQRDDLTKSQYGMTPNKNLLARARTCAACHIGDSDRDMNHDIIAAGHPALDYEFATFHNRLPKHWREPESQDFTAQLRLAGQIASLDASLALLEARAMKRLATSTWPEFSHADCAVCHQNLRLTNKLNSAVTSAPQTLLSWNLSGVEQLLMLIRNDNGGQVAGAVLEQKLTELSQSLDSGRVANRQVAAQNARASRAALDDWLRYWCCELDTLSAKQLQHSLEALDSPPVYLEPSRL